MNLKFLQIPKASQITFKMKLNTALIIYWLCTILEVKTHGDSTSCCYLEGRIANKKWKTYEVFLDNCLVRKFIEEAESPNFYQLFQELEESVNKTIALYASRLDGFTDQSSGSKVESEIKTKVRTRWLKQRVTELQNMLDSMRIELTLIEAQIRDSMDDCMLRGEAEVDGPANCAKRLPKSSARVKEFCETVEAQNALLLTELSSHQSVT